MTREADASRYDARLFPPDLLASTGGVLSGNVVHLVFKARSLARAINRTSGFEGGLVVRHYTRDCCNEELNIRPQRCDVAKTSQWSWPVLADGCACFAEIAPHHRGAIRLSNA